MTIQPAVLHVLVGANCITDEDQRRLQQQFPHIRFSLAASAEQAMIDAPDAEVIFTKGVESAITGAQGITAEALGAAQNLRWYQAGTAGVEGTIRILREHHATRDVILTNARGAHGIPLAENVILSHHTGGSSPLNSGRLTDLFRQNLGRYLRGEMLENVVDWERGY